MSEPTEVTAEDARRRFADLLNSTQWHGHHVAITRNGRRAGVVVPPDWYDAHNQPEEPDR